MHMKRTALALALGLALAAPVAADVLYTSGPPTGLSGTSIAGPTQVSVPFTLLVDSVITEIDFTVWDATGSVTTEVNWRIVDLSDNDPVGGPAQWSVVPTALGPAGLFDAYLDALQIVSCTDPVCQRHSGLQLAAGSYTFNLWSVDGVTPEWADAGTGESFQVLGLPALNDPPAEVNEPGTLALAGIALLGLALGRKR